jgi:2-polyprenyl-6-methoxyphenol hydroxylase-like FAD-dependent oxidoreductase
MGVIKLDQWYRGRVALAGDAAHSPSAMTGMGTSSAMAGVYILAGEIGRHCGGGSGSSKQNITGSSDLLWTRFRKG